MRCVGYRQAWEYLDGAIDRPALRELGIIATEALRTEAKKGTVARALGAAGGG